MTRFEEIRLIAGMVKILLPAQKRVLFIALVNAIAKIVGLSQYLEKVFRVHCWPETSLYNIELFVY